MKLFWKYLLVRASLSVVVLLASANRITPVRAQSPDTQNRQIHGRFVSEPVMPKLSQEVRRLPTAKRRQLGEPVPEVNPRQRGNFEPRGTFSSGAQAKDPLVQSVSGTLLKTPAVISSFEGISLITGGAGVPPDTVGDVGPNHYVQMVNSSFAIFDKSGMLLTGPTNINALWTGAGGLCEANNNGDPIVLYDPLADRWLLSQFAVPGPTYALCIAISQTPDPTGAYYLYEFSTGTSFPDYPKFGVWPDGYYMSANESSYTAYAFDRTTMLAGDPATFQKFTGETNLLLPGDFDGHALPPVGSPNYFYTFKDNAFHGGGADRLEVFAFHVDWDTPGNSTFTLAASLPVASFTYTVCGFFVFTCIPQPTPGETVDALSEWPMWRLQYRNFGDRETLVGNFTVDVGSDQAGIRWFELRKSGGSAWSLYQEGTHAPDSSHRWMGSAAMDQRGNIALGYSVSSSSLAPSIRYATRLITDTLGTLQSEVTLIAGGGVQTGGFHRWGDYSSMNVDPVDDCTFWYTNEYYQTTSAANWQTRVGTFKIPSCEGTRIYLPFILKSS